MLLGDGVLGQRPRPAAAAPRSASALSAAGTWFLRTVSTRVQRRFRDKVTIALESHVARLQASIATIAHQERPDYLDRLSVLRDQVFVLDHMYMSVFSTCGWILRLGVTIALLVVDPPALVLLALFALPTVLTSTWRPGVERAAQERGAQSARLARHLFDIATTAPPGKEVRVTGIGERLVDRAPRGVGALVRAGGGGALGLAPLWHTLAWAVFGAGYVGAVVFVVVGARRAGRATCCSCSRRARGCRPTSARRSARSGSCAASGWTAPGGWPGSRTTPRRSRPTPIARCPSGSHDGIRLDHVSFAYPGTDRLVLDDVSLTLPAGAVVAIVGENGAGKTTLVKLLAKLYEPTSGAILVDDDAARAHAGRRVARAAGRRVPGLLPLRVPRRAQRSALGDVPRDGRRARRSIAAVDRAGADDVVARLPSGLDTQLGPTWPGGVEVSFGQWQKLALARGFMREQPLLLVLDEPTAALDAETEHALFERYAEAARDPRRRRRPHHDPRVAPLLHRAHGRPDRRARRRGSSRSARTRS